MAVRPAAHRRAAFFRGGSTRPRAALGGGGRRRDPVCLRAAAAEAANLAADLARRAGRLAEAAPKLRAKGAGAALQALLDEDSLSAASQIPGRSERGARRLFERLVALEALRELTGRATFRLYGLSMAV